LKEKELRQGRNVEAFPLDIDVERSRLRRGVAVWWVNNRGGAEDADAQPRFLEALADSALRKRLIRFQVPSGRDPLVESVVMHEEYPAVANEVSGADQ